MRSGSALNKMHGLRFVTAAEVEWIAANHGDAVIAYLATWNRRCQEFAERYRAFAARHAGALAVVCVDVDTSVALTAAHDVCSVPTILLLRRGVEVYREVGIDLGPLEARIAAPGYPAGGGAPTAGR